MRSNGLADADVRKAARVCRLAGWHIALTGECRGAYASAGQPIQCDSHVSALVWHCVSAPCGTKSTSYIGGLSVSQLPQKSCV